MGDAFFLCELCLLVLPLLAFLFRHHSSDPAMVRPADVPRIKLNNGKEIPVIGLGMSTILVLQRWWLPLTSRVQERGSRKQIKSPLPLSTL